MNTIVAISSLIILCSAIVASQESDLPFGSACKENSECKSQHCISICDRVGEKKACTEPDWYYLRHGKQIPTCMPPSYVRRKVGSIPFIRERAIGHSCHSDNNCQSKHCLPMCESSTTMWRCVEPRSFFERQKLDVPKCTKLSYIESFRQQQKLAKAKELEKAVSTVRKTNSDENPNSVEAEENSAIVALEASRMLGQTCEQHAECFSSNCVPVCTEASENKESRCIEPRLSFTMHNLPVPTCIGAEAAYDLMKLVVSSVEADKNKIEEVIWKRLHLLSTPDDEDKPTNVRKDSSNSQSSKSVINIKTEANLTVTIETKKLQ